ncbi:MAG: signal recognition particle-docking protein FtsY [Holosporales bacterium]|jgi:fused signal recognition particle receptor|nr:signal recognition particle-docking protein FtsY [Holosporales bacterium]
MAWDQLKNALSKTSQAFSEKLSLILAGKRLDVETLSKLEDLLITADVGPQCVTAILSTLKKERFENTLALEAVQEALIETIVPILAPYRRPLEDLAYVPKNTPTVILLAGVNGNGKTTTIAKLAHFLQKHRRCVRFAACDTFRAAAAEQLCYWGKQLSIPVRTAPHGSDAAALAYNALKETQVGEILLIDTAGRLHTRDDLMASLEKICRVLRKISPNAPHEAILVLDATTGQEALAQAAAFQNCMNISGLVITKLDGTAKGGIVIPLVQQYKIPILAIGTGERPEDLCAFHPRDFAENLIRKAVI